jgi:hypothetical protein
MPFKAIIGPVMSLTGGLIQGSRSADAAGQQAKAYRDAATNASNLAQFRPVGTTTNFGTSNYTYDPNTGRLTSAGYSLSPQLQGLQSGLMGAASSYNYQPDVGFVNGIRENSLAGMRMAMQQAPNAFNAGNQLYARSQELYPQAGLAYGQGQSLFGQGTAVAGQAPELFSRAADLYSTGASYLGSAPQAEADYMARTSAALAPRDEQNLAVLRNRIYQTGRAGLATGGTTAGGMLASNPELSAYYNSLAQRDLDMATKAQAEGRANVTLGGNLYGQGAQLGTAGAGIAGTGAQIQGVGGQLFNVGANQYQTAGGLVGVGNQSLATGGGLLETSSKLGTNAINQELGKYSIQNAALNTLGNYLTQSKAVEEMGMQPYRMSNELAGNVANAGANQGRFIMSGETSAAPLSYANASYSPTGQFFSSAGSQLSGGGATNQGSTLNTWFNNFIRQSNQSSPGFTGPSYIPSN